MLHADWIAQAHSLRHNRTRTCAEIHRYVALLSDKNKHAR